MKNNTLHFLAYAMVVTLMLSCSARHDADEEASADWKEMDEFHMIMAESFHPFRDSGNLEPTFRYAVLMDSLAGAWGEASLPSKVDNEDMKATLRDLKSETARLASYVAAGDSTQVSATLDHLHDVFHHIQELWYGAGSEHHEGEEHH